MYKFENLEDNEDDNICINLKIYTLHINELWMYVHISWSVKEYKDRQILTFTNIYVLCMCVNMSKWIDMCIIMRKYIYVYNSD